MSFSASFSSKSLPADEGTFFSNEGLEFSAVLWRQTTLATFIATFELSLTLAILFQLGGCVGTQSRGRDARG